MHLHVIVMAHGQQTRLAHLAHPKHLLRLQRCGETILGRTLRLVAIYGHAAAANLSVTVVGPQAIREAVLEKTTGFEGTTGSAWMRHSGHHAVGARGISSLYLDVLSFKGVFSDILRNLDALMEVPLPDADGTVVLLGDVVFSHDAMQQIVRERPPVLFAGTPRVGPAHGELFAMAWDASRDGDVRKALAATPRSAFRNVYQCGQLRNFLWHWQSVLSPPPPGATPTLCVRPELGHYLPIGDYTNDVDTSADVEYLPTLDELAYRDEENTYLTSLGG